MTIDRRFEAFRSLIAEDETVEWIGASGTGRSLRWMKWQFVMSFLALAAGAGIEPIPEIASFVTHSLFGGFGAGAESGAGRVFGLDMATVLVRVALAGWGGVTLFGAVCLVLSKGSEIHLVTDRRVLSLSGNEASVARLSEIGKVGVDVTAGQGSLTLALSGKDDFYMIGLDDHRGALAAISRGMAMTKGFLVELPVEGEQEAAGEPDGPRDGEG